MMPKMRPSRQRRQRGMGEQVATCEARPREAWCGHQGHCRRTGHSQTGPAAPVVTGHTPFDKLERLCYTLGHDAWHHFISPSARSELVTGNVFRTLRGLQCAIRSRCFFAKRTHFSQLCVVIVHPSAKRPAAVGRGCRASRCRWAGPRSVLSPANGPNPGRPGPRQLTHYRRPQQPCLPG